MSEHLDVLIVGAGLSGIGAARHLQAECPGRSFAILEARAASGGTWDLFRYPGIRSDSDMFTLGYGFRPWTQARSIADGPSILDYIRETAEEAGIDERIRFHHRVVRASWSSADDRWTVTAQRTDTGEEVTLTCGFLLMCSGYYRYDRGHTPEFPGAERFGGQIVHPQFWTDDVEYAGKRVVVIGSGATAVTLVPALAAGGAEHVTMLQRSPTYILSVPGRDPLADLLRGVLPQRVAYPLVRWKNVLLSAALFQLCRRAPGLMRRVLRRGVQHQLEGWDLEPDFVPRYEPWDQRLCLVPDGDLFRTLRDGRASVVTGEIDEFTATGIRLRSGEELPADLIVTATGLELLLLGGAEVEVDGELVDFPQTLAYKGMMFSDVPNLAAAIGYTNASWTLKADLVSAYVCRLLNHMADHGYTRCVPRNDDPAMPTEPFLALTAGYVTRAADSFPRQGEEDPWRLNQNYLRDVTVLRWGPIEDGVIEFGRAAVPAGAAAPA
ncbi:MAG: NAD(P)-binding protein [Actinobacteria bacterium]|nr:NAD(P)-binding protein [Actinomycetota bacterium]